MSNVSGSPATPPQDAARGTRKEVIRLLIVGLVSMATGYLLIFLLLAPHDQQVSEQELPSVDLSPQKATLPSPVATATPAEPPVQNQTGPVIPKGEIPRNVHLINKPTMQKCIDHSGLEWTDDHCDQLAALSKRMNDRLYVVARCNDEVNGPTVTGHLALGAEFNVATSQTSFWSMEPSSIARSDQLIDCIRKRLGGFPLDQLDNRFDRYQLRFDIDFGDATAPSATTANTTGTTNTEPTLEAAKKGRLVAVVKKRVRVRETKVDGKPIGRISAPNKVSLLKQEGAWCQVITPNNNTGWMICNALEL